MLNRNWFPLFKVPPPKFWTRYVDDILALVDTNFNIFNFLNFLNNLYPSLKFTFEEEFQDKIPFLDILIHRFPSSLKFSVFRKSTHANSYLHYFSFHSSKVKLSVPQGLFLRALRICSPEFLQKEFDFIFASFSSLGYPKPILMSALSRAKRSFYRPVPRTPTDSAKKYIVTPYVPSLDSPVLLQILRSQGSRLVFNHRNTLKSSLTCNNYSTKVPNVGVYSIPCKDCDKVYFGETGRDLQVRIKEHKSDFSKCNFSNALFSHSFNTGHSIDFCSSRLIYKCNNFIRRRLVESSCIDFYATRSLNQNRGFYDCNPPVSSFIAKSVNFQ